MDKKNLIIIGLVAVILIIGIWQFVKPSVTGNVVNTGADTIVDSETTEEDLTEESKVVNEIDYNVRVQDELTNKPLQDAFVYLDGKFIGKTSNKGELTVDSVEFGKHSLRADYKGESNILTEEISELNNRATIYIKAPRTITLELKDSETNRPINDVKVFLETTNGKAHYNPLSTTDEGKTQFNDILPGDYQIRIEEFPNAKPSKLVTIGASDFITAEVDMPNPRFRGSSIVCEEKFILFEGHYGVCSVTLKNDGNRDSEDTTVVLRIYKQEDGEFVKIGGETLNFGSIPKGDSVSLTTERHKEFSGSYEEYVVAVIYEGWRYTPEDTSKLDDATIPQGIMNKFVTETANWCSDDIQRCGETAAEIGKAVVGIIGMI